MKSSIQITHNVKQQMGIFLKSYYEWLFEYCIQVQLLMALQLKTIYIRHRTVACF